MTRSALRHSEISANLLSGLMSNFPDFSERALTDNGNQLDFDSSIPRFESWHASQVKALKKKRNLAALPGSFCRVCFLCDRCSRRASCGLAGHAPAARCASSDIYRQEGLVALGSSLPGHHDESRALILHRFLSKLANRVS